MQCKIETKITVPDSSFMYEFDLNMLLGNLLDNALEALEKVKERYLYIGISFRNGILLIRMWNSFDGIVSKKGKRRLLYVPNQFFAGRSLSVLKKTNL